MAESDENTLTPSDLRNWLQGEVGDVMKAAELRIQDATQLVTAYVAGELTATQASDRLVAYQTKWDEAPLLGSGSREPLTDDEIRQRRHEELPPIVRKIVERLEAQNKGGQTRE